MNRDALPAILALGAGAASLAFIFVQGSSESWLVLVITTLFFAASLSHAALSRGRRAALGLLAIVTAGSLCIEIFGVRYSLPFGPYVYGDGLGWRVFGVPLLVPLAWTMVAYPAAVLASRITSNRFRGSIAAGFSLGAWDLLVDPLMVRGGYWHWNSSGPDLSGIPLTNYFGWIGMATLMTILLWPLLARRQSTVELDDRVPIALYAGSGAMLFVKALVQGMPDVALIGAAGIGTMVGLLVIRRHPARARGWPQPAIVMENSHDVSGAGH